MTKFIKKKDSQVIEKNESEPLHIRSGANVIIEELDSESGDDQTIEATKNVYITDVTGKTPEVESATKQSSDTSQEVRIELDHIVEYQGHSYRGVQFVNESLAKILIDLDQNQNKDGNSTKE
jgi:hypothetical protein